VKEKPKPAVVWLAVFAISGAAFLIAGAASRAVSASTNGAPGDATSVYNSKCASCHGRDGRARSMHGKHEHARDLTTAEWQDSVSDERIYNSISNGKGKMPAFKKKLSDSQIDELVSYVRRLRK
jgi:mono/diheme cytochrome c family protein